MAKIKYPYRYITKTACLPAKFFSDLSNLMTGVMDLYFGKNNQKNKYIEKQRQHELFSVLTNAQDGYYVYDLEFSQKYDSVSSRTAEGKQNHPDMLGIRYKNGLPKALVLIEVKSTEAACKDEKSGLDKHSDGMKKYLSSHHMPEREKEAKVTLVLLSNTPDFRFSSHIISECDRLPLPARQKWKETPAGQSTAPSASVSLLPDG